jgi:antitoxin component YwqK of YwqJK toxin-antitoxin module
MKKLLLLLFIIPLFTFSQQETKREHYASGKLLSIINYNVGVREGSCKYFYIMEHGRYCQNQIIKRVS